MKDLWLIQRGVFREINNDQITGMDSIIRWSYMGSAEFEFGALPQSLRRIAENKNCFSFKQIDSIMDLQNNPAIVYYHEDISNEIVDAVNHLAKNDYGYKEAALMNKYIKQGCSGLSDANFWWDVENDFFVMFGDNHRKQVEIAIEKLCEKWVTKTPKKNSIFKLWKSNDISGRR